MMVTGAGAASLGAEREVAASIASQRRSCSIRAALRSASVPSRYPAPAP